MDKTGVGPGAYRPVYEHGGGLPVRLEVTEVEQRPGNHYLHHRLVVGEGRPAAVVAAEADGALLLVRIYRRSVGATGWELPRGSSDVGDAYAEGGAVADGDTVADDDYSDATLIRAGMRELLEETGYVGREARVIGRYVADTAVFPQRIGIVHCLVDHEAVPGQTDGEVEGSRFFTFERLRGMVSRSEILDSHTLAALAFLGSL